jgi:hypothetical protein
MARTPFVAIASWGRERSVTRYEKRNKKIAVTSYPPRGRRRGLLGLPANEHGGVVCRASCVVCRMPCRPHSGARWEGTESEAPHARKQRVGAS